MVPVQRTVFVPLPVILECTTGPQYICTTLVQGRVEH
jgi:hypothetical protein